MTNNNQYKSIFLSDIHLGFNGCQNEKLESFNFNLGTSSPLCNMTILKLWAYCLTQRSASRSFSINIISFFSLCEITQGD